MTPIARERRNKPEQRSNKSKCPNLVRRPNRSTWPLSLCDIFSDWFARKRQTLRKYFLRNTHGNRSFGTTVKMRSAIFFISVGVACLVFCCGVRCSGFSKENNVWEEDFPGLGSESALEPRLYDDPVTGPEKLPVDILEGDESEEKEKLPESEVDEETIRKAEKNAEEDLLNGLNRILKNNETLEDVFRAENVYEIP